MDRRERIQEYEIAQALVAKADEMVHKLEKVLSQPAPRGMGDQVGYSIGISDELEMALFYFTFRESQLGWRRRRKLNGQINAIRDLTKRLNLDFMDYVRAYYRDSERSNALRTKMLETAASIKAETHSFAKEFLEPS